MAETPPSDQTQTQSFTQGPAGSDPNALHYWCYQCNKRVSIETRADLPDVVCHECKNGFVESVGPPPSSLPAGASDPVDDPAFGNQFLQVLRLIAQSAREDDAPPPPPSEHADPSDDDYLRIEIDAWNNNDDDENDIGERNDGVENQRRENNEDRDGSEDEDDEGDGDENEDNENQGEMDEDDLRRRRREVLRLRLRDFAARAANRRNRILDWAEILMGLEDHSIELRLAMPEYDSYIGNPGDYVDAAGYEALLQNLAESDSGGRRGAPPASKAAIEALKTMVIKAESESLTCAICKDVTSIGEMVKKLPCGHGYHGGCIVTWLGSRNSCPVCRFELPTDDPEYEDDRKKRAAHPAASTSGGSGSPIYDSDFL